ncbi:cytochrome P450 [Parapedomonas caeni]
MALDRTASPGTGFDAAAFAASFDLRSPPPGFIDNPYPFYHALREHQPVRRMPDGSVFLTRHADLELVYRQPLLFSSDKKAEFLPKFGDTLLYQHHTTSLVFNDPPLHTRVRTILKGALANRTIAHMEPGIIALVDSLLDAGAAHGEMDLIEDFASAIPVEVIGNLLGVPHADRGPLRGWSLSILGALEPVVPAAALAEANQNVADFLDYLRDLVADRRANLRDPDIDILSRLIIGEAGGERLSETELLQNCIFLLNAGHETTTNLIGNALMTLLEWPAEKARLIADPSLLDTAIEEFLRFESSNQLGNRRVLTDTEVGGEALPAGTLVTLCIGAANRDPARFPDPDRLDLARGANRHLAFASGTHLCLGANLARLEGRIAIGRFLARFPDYRLNAPAERSQRLRFRGFLRAPVTLGC